MYLNVNPKKNLCSFLFFQFELKTKKKLKKNQINWYSSVPQNHKNKSIWNKEIIIFKFALQLN